MEQEMRGTNGQRKLMPLSICQPVRKRLGPGLPFMHIVVSDLIPQTTALQFKIAACKGTKTWFYFWISQSSILTTSLPPFSESTISYTRHKDLLTKNQLYCMESNSPIVGEPHRDTLSLWHGYRSIHCEEIGHKLISEAWYRVSSNT